jgi:hypothetical protein
MIGAPGLQGRIFIAAALDGEFAARSRRALALAPGEGTVGIEAIKPRV